MLLFFPLLRLNEQFNILKMTSYSICDGEVHPGQIASYFPCDTGLLPSYDHKEDKQLTKHFLALGTCSPSHNLSESLVSLMAFSIEYDGPVQRQENTIRKRHGAFILFYSTKD